MLIVQEPKTATIADPKAYSLNCRGDLSKLNEWGQVEAKPKLT